MVCGVDWGHQPRRTKRLQCRPKEWRFSICVSLWLSDQAFSLLIFRLWDRSGTCFLGVLTSATKDWVAEGGRCYQREAQKAGVRTFVGSGGALLGLCFGTRALHCGTWVHKCSTWDLSPQGRDRTCVPCIGRRILNCWTSREGPERGLLMQPSHPFSLFLPRQGLELCFPGNTLRML